MLHLHLGPTKARAEWPPTAIATTARGRYAPRVSNQSGGQPSSPFEPPPWAGPPAPPTNPGQQSGAPGDPAYPTYQPVPAYPMYQPPSVPDHSRDRHSGEPASVVGLVLALVGLAVASLMWLFGVMLPLVPMLIVMTMVLLVAVLGGILVGRAVTRLGRVHAILGLVAAGAAAVISVTFLLPMVIDPPWRDWWTCSYQADTPEQQNACDVAYNTATG